MVGARLASIPRSMAAKYWHHSTLNLYGYLFYERLWSPVSVKFGRLANEVQHRLAIEVKLIENPKDFSTWMGPGLDVPCSMICCLNYSPYYHWVDRSLIRFYGFKSKLVIDDLHFITVCYSHSPRTDWKRLDSSSAFPITLIMFFLRIALNLIWPVELRIYPQQNEFKANIMSLLIRTSNACRWPTKMAVKASNI